MKKTLALILGVIMLMGCLSVSAANSALEVAEKPANAIFYEDFSGATLDTVHIATGSASLADGALTAEPAPATNFAKITFAPEGILTPVYLEYDVIQTGLKNVADVQIQMSLQSTAGTFLDFRWYNGNPAYIRSVANPSVDATCDGAVAHIKFKIDGANKKLGMWVNDTLLIDENNCASSIRYYDSFRNLVSMNIDLNKQIAGLKIDNVKLYSAVESTIPGVGEEICHYDFDQAGTYAANDVMTANDRTTYTLADGQLKMDADSNERSTWIYFTPEHTRLTGKYVVEFTVGDPWYRSNQLHRFEYGGSSGGTHYLQWEAAANSSYGTSRTLLFRHSGGGSVTPQGAGNVSGYSVYDGNYESTDRMSEFSATGATDLTVTRLFDTDANTVDTWFNGVYAGQVSFTNDPNDNYTSIEGINFNLYSGVVYLKDLRVYRPMAFDAKGLSITEDANSVNIATNAEKAGRLYFATYEGSALDAIGTTALSMAPGKVYKVSKADWVGAKAFFWDADMKPIVDSWDLQ